MLHAGRDCLKAALWAAWDVATDEFGWLSRSEPVEGGAMDSFEQLVGTWTTEAVHRLLPDVVVRGETVVEWLEGRKFLIVRARNDHPDFPDSISIIGDTDGMCMHYFDSRGVYRIYRTELTENGWQIARDVPGFSQHFTGTFEDGGNTISGLWKLSEDDETWADDLTITYRRA